MKLTPDMQRLKNITNLCDRIIEYVEYMDKKEYDAMRSFTIARSGIMLPFHHPFLMKEE